MKLLFYEQKQQNLLFFSIAEVGKINLLIIIITKITLN